MIEMAKFIAEIAHIDYIRHTQEEAATLKELVESERLLSPLNISLAYAWWLVVGEVITGQETMFGSCRSGVRGSRHISHGIDLWLEVQIFYDHVNLVTRRTIDQSADGKLRDRNTEESWALLEDLALYDNEIWNDPMDFAKSVKAISLPQDVLSTFDCRLINLENHVQRLMEAHIAPKKLVRVNKITSSCEICSGPHDTQDDSDMMFIEIIKKNDDSREEDPEVDANAEAGELEVEYFDILPTWSELAYHN
nr:MAK10-like protein [Tanacetum cinerariifolium]